MTPWSRRSVLATAAAVGGSLAGCLGSGVAGSEGASTRASPLSLPSLAVAGSPGGTVPVRQPDTVSLLDFFGTWCAPCKPQMAHLRTIREEFPGIHMISITWETDDAAVADFWREYEGTWPVAQDPDLRSGERYGIRSIPTLVLLAADGTEVWCHTGLVAAEDIAAQVEAARA
jgi:thiol-disulfide isomerase/thioredoxin